MFGKYFKIIQFVKVVFYTTPVSAPYSIFTSVFHLKKL